MGGVTSGIRALVYDTDFVRSAFRLTLPTDESSVKTILLKMRWIDLSSSLLFLTSIIFSSYLCEFWSLRSYLFSES